jgi:transcription initiation factor TFIID subunit 1
MSTTTSLDFSRLVSREYRAAGVAQLKTRKKYTLKKRSIKFLEDQEEETNKETRHNKIMHDLTVATKDSFIQEVKSKEEQEEEASRLVLQLVSKTPAYIRHLQTSEETTKIVDDTELKTYIKIPNEVSSSLKHHEFSPSFHQVELGDWESKIQWGGYDGVEESSSATVSAENKDDKTSSNYAVSFLQKCRNPFLDNMDFDNMISWTDCKDDVQERARNLPLILELGVAGQSIAKYVLPSHRPPPCVKSMEYQTRIQANWTGEIKSTAELSKGTLHADKEQKERFIQQRQEKRRQMAKDKTNRVTEAMGTLNVLAGGRGRTITSSLMGPGGTERTGRPSRRIGNASHDTEYVEQLDMVTNHSLFRDLSKVSLRQYHRPKLPWTIVRTTLLWQFAIRYSASNKKGGPSTGSGGADSNSSSYQAMMMGTHAGAVSKAKLRSEADLSPTEGKLVIFEYSEESPPIQLTKGMASKIVTYYRGDKARCPFSAGGGDRPTRRRAAKSDNNKTSVVNPTQDSKSFEKLHRLKGPNHAMKTTIIDWVGKPRKKNREENNNEKASINVLPEGVTEILHPKVHGPFIGEIEDGQAVTGLVSNLFVAPIVRHEPEQTDFLMVLGRNSGATANGRLETLSVILRELPASIFAVGQTEPRTRVYAPNTQGEKNFTGPLVSYLIAKVLARTENREGHGLRLDEIQERVMPNVGLANNALRQRLKHVAIYDKNTQIWTTKQIGYEDYPGVDALGKQLAAEGIAAYEVANAAVTRLKDLGIYQLFVGAHACQSVGVAMVYLAGQVNAVRELARKVKNLVKYSRSDSSRRLQMKFYEAAAVELEALSKALRQRHEVAKFIHEQLQLAPWHLTGEFWDVHKRGEGTGMMKLTGLGDPSGIGEGFSFLRENDTKPSKSVVPGPVVQKDKITGTEDDLRKLTMKQMASILRSYDMPQNKIDTLKRWDRVHVIRDLSTKAASDGIGDGLERFARGEKMKLSDQKQMYRDRIQVIWKRQIAALSADLVSGVAIGSEGGALSEADDLVSAKSGDAKKDNRANGDSDSDDDEDFAAAMEEEMMDRADANQLVAAQTGEGTGVSGELRSAIQDQDLTKDARELAALKRRKAEERAAREGLSTLTDEKMQHNPLPFNRKIVRKRITKTYPDGRQITTFKFIVHPEEVGKIIDRLSEQKNDSRRPTEQPDYPPDEKQIGHAIFEDEDDFEFSTRGRGSGLKGRGKRRVRSGTTAKGHPRIKTQFGKLRTTISKEQRQKKRKRDEEEAEIYASVAKRKGTSNRKERGSIRERRPHVILSDRFEAIRLLVESRPSSTPFHKRVNQRTLPQYYEKISHPIDLSAIRDKIKK